MERPGIGLRSRSCPACGCINDFDVVLQADFDEARLGEFAFSSRKFPEFMSFQMVLCGECDLLFANPAPSPEWHRIGYGSAAFDTGLESRWAAKTYARRLPWLTSRLPDQDGALDIGTGDGAFLAELVAAGFTSVSGLEPSPFAVDDSPPDVRRLIRRGFFDAADFEPETMSLVTCFQVLEHVENPEELVFGVFRLLKPGGAMITVTHNFRSLSARILGSRSPIFDIEHLQLFSPESLRALMRRAGFVGDQLAPFLNIYPLSYWVKLLSVRDGIKGTVLTMLDQFRVGRLPLPLWAGNIWAVAFKPCQSLA